MCLNRCLLGARSALRKEILHRNITERGPLEYLEPSKPSALPKLPKKHTEALPFRPFEGSEEPLKGLLRQF